MNTATTRDPYAPEITYEQVLVVRFLDTATDRRWFMRAHETLGHVQNVAHAEGRVYDRKSLLAYVAANFGPDAFAVCL